MLVSKTQSTYDILRGLGLLYEIASTQDRGGNPARLYAAALDRFNLAVSAVGEIEELEEDDKTSASEAATAYLEFFFNKAPKPGWL